VLLPHDHEHVAVGEHLEVVVKVEVGRGERVGPGAVALPVELLDAAGETAGPALRCLPWSEALRRHAAGADQAAVGKELGRRGEEIARPTPHLVALHVDEVGRRGVHRREERVALVGSRGIVGDQPHGVGQQATVLESLGCPAESRRSVAA
jgi:hypothetical protein